MDSGVFLDLTGMFDYLSIDKKEYNQAVLLSGSFREKLYVIPLCYTQSLIMTLDETLPKFGFTDQDMRSLEDMLVVFETIQKSKTRLFAHDDYEQIFGYLTAVCFPGVFNYESSELRVRNKLFERLIAVIHEEYILSDKRDTQYSIEGYKGEDLTKNIADGEAAFLLSYTLFSHYTRATALSQYGQISVYPIPGYEGDVSAFAGFSVAVNANMRFREEALRFIEIMLDDDSQSRIELDIVIPIRIESAESLSETWVDRAQEYIDRGFIEGIDNETKVPDSIPGLIERNTFSVTNAVLNNKDYFDLYEFFEPYIKGDKSYESCLAEAENYYKIYLSE